MNPYIGSLEEYTPLHSIHYPTCNMSKCKSIIKHQVQVQALDQSGDFAIAQKSFCPIKSGVGGGNLSKHGICLPPLPPLPINFGPIESYVFTVLL